MSDYPSQPAARTGWGEARKIGLEAVVVGVALAGMAFLANGVSPRGLKLTFNYFDDGAARPAPVAVAPGTNSGGPAAVTPTTTEPAPTLAARLEKQGLHLIDSAAVAQLSVDPRMAQNLVLFIDARDPDHYQEGHIPGAYEFDRYHPEKYMTTVLPLCQIAEQIVVYCTGGECEDSEFAAIFLRDAGTAAGKIFVYGGGITEWTAQGRPVETGERNSGQIHNGAK